MNIRKRPLIIEFTGPPNSGKTTVIQSLKPALEKKGLRVDVKQEDAELVPKYIPKKTWIRNSWIAFGQLQSLIEAVSSDCDVVLLDRGFFDAIFWTDFLNSQNICTDFECFNMKKLFYDFDNSFHFKPDLLYIIDVSTEESLRRRYADSNEEAPVLSTNSFIDSYKKTLNNFSKTVEITCSTLDTSSLTKDEMCNMVLSRIVDLNAFKKILESVQ